MKKKDCAAVVFAALREGCSLYAACTKAGITTKVFYGFLTEDGGLAAEYHLALADYADKCTDNIKAIAENLKAGEIDNSTAKLLIETEKWLAQKACPQPYAGGASGGDGEEAETAEIVVRFV